MTLGAIVFSFLNHKAAIVPQRHATLLDILTTEICSNPIIS